MNMKSMTTLPLIRAEWKLPLMETWTDLKESGAEWKRLQDGYSKVDAFLQEFQAKEAQVKAFGTATDQPWTKTTEVSCCVGNNRYSDPVLSGSVQYDPKANKTIASSITHNGEGWGIGGWGVVGSEKFVHQPSPDGEVYRYSRQTREQVCDFANSEFRTKELIVDNKQGTLTFIESAQTDSSFSPRGGADG